MTGQGQLITGVVVGAGAMYLLDPECGARRRSLLQESGAEVGHQLSERFPAVGALASRRPSAGLDRKSWSPGVRLILGAAGGLLALKGLRMRGVGGEVLTALGTGLLARAASNTPPQPLGDLGSGESSAAGSSGFSEQEAPVDATPPQEQEEEVTAHASSHRRTTKSTKRRRSRE
ncbi:MAG TPA: hypothetical protein VGN76_12725 [Gemmatimonadales bacterium]|jgi:hypothetical protein|nr:hypothetical protein [Gemmatimonadales bacterium]